MDKKIKKTYINNSYFMEFVDEIATQLTELNFHEETFDMDNETDMLGFTPEAKEFYNERYDEVERMTNNIMGVYSKNIKQKKIKENKVNDGFNYFNSGILEELTTDKKYYVKAFMDYIIELENKLTTKKK